MASCDNDSEHWPGFSIDQKRKLETLYTYYWDCIEKLENLRNGECTTENMEWLKQSNIDFEKIINTDDMQLLECEDEVDKSINELRNEIEMDIEDNDAIDNHKTEKEKNKSNSKSNKTNKKKKNKPEDLFKYLKDKLVTEKEPVCQDLENKLKEARDCNTISTILKETHSICKKEKTKVIKNSLIFGYALEQAFILVKK